MKFLRPAIIMLAVAAAAPAAHAFSPGEEGQVSGLACATGAPMLKMIDVARDSPDRIARLYMNEDLPRHGDCGILPGQIAVSLEESKGSFVLDGHEYAIVRVKGNDTGATLYVLIRADKLP